MPLALAIETSSRVGSIAIVQDARVLAEDQFQHGLQHAAEIVSRIDRLCRGLGCLPADLREIYVSAGPGSFTGLRIGVTLAKTLAFVTGVRIIAVPTVRVLAANGPAGATNLIIVLDAKRGQIYTARFARFADSWIEQEPAHLDELSAVLRRSPRPVWLLGEGIPYHRQLLPADDVSVIIAPQENWRPTAAAVAQEGALLASRGEFVEPDRLVPIYIRTPEAQEKWEQTHGTRRS